MTDPAADLSVAYRTARFSGPLSDPLTLADAAARDELRATHRGGW